MYDRWVYQTYFSEPFAVSNIWIAHVNIGNIRKYVKRHLNIITSKAYANVPVPV